MRSTTAAARTAGSHGIEMRMVQALRLAEERVAPPAVTIRSSVPSLPANSAASPQMRPVETTTRQPRLRANATASRVSGAIWLAGVSAVPSRSSAINLY